MAVATQVSTHEAGSSGAFVPLARSVLERRKPRSEPSALPFEVAAADVEVAEIFALHGHDAAFTIGQATGRNFVFRPASRAGLLHFNVQGGLAVFTVYCGPEAGYLGTVVEAFEYARARGWTPALLEREERLSALEELGLSATCIGAWQDLPSVSDFTLEGGSMRRLRYCYSRYAALPGAALVEYRPGSSPAIDQRIAEIAQAWASGKGAVPRYIRELRSELPGWAKDPNHRFFITTASERIDNFIVVSSAGQRQGYVLDLELYPEDAAFGHLEYGVVEIVRRLRAEHCAYFSLGLTMGLDLEQPANADPGLRRELERLRRMGAFNGDGNFQFKNKFRTVVHPAYICGLPERAPGLIKIVRMLADPFREPDYGRLRESLLGLSEAGEYAVSASADTKAA